jgi:hypothetical protein
MKKSIFFMLLFSSTLGVQAQTISMQPPQIIPVSPEAADVQRYASYPVDYSTGIPDISIPLYEIKAGDIVLPVTLSYHSAGLKPKEPSGRVGTGWTLNAEPSVMRSIRGLVDNTESIALTDDDLLTKRICRDLIDGKKDGEPDVYSYTLNPGGGTCYRATFDHTQFVSHPRSNDKMKITNNLVSITTGDGLVYHFGDGDNAQEKSQTNSNPQITRWLCDRISSLKTDAQITFSYQQGSYPVIDNYYNMHDFKIIEQSRDKVFNIYSDSYRQTIYGLYLNGNYGNYSIIEENYLGAPHGFAFPNLSVQRSKLGVISFNGHTVHFGYNSHEGEDYVSEMTVTDAGGTQIRRIQFFITKYHEYTEQTKLDSVRISAPDCETRTYRFDYYYKTLVSNRESRAIDHWGFYNGTGNHSRNSVPTIYTRLEFSDGIRILPMATDTIEGSDREPSAICTQYGMLKEIIHPEGAVTGFEYEGNSGIFSVYYRGVNYDENALQASCRRIANCKNYGIYPGQVSAKKTGYGQDIQIRINAESL